MRFLCTVTLLGLSTLAFLCAAPPAEARPWVYYPGQAYYYGGPYYYSSSYYYSPYGGYTAVSPYYNPSYYSVSPYTSSYYYVAPSTYTYVQPATYVEPTYQSYYPPPSQLRTVATPVATTVVVNMKDNAFEPMSMEIRPGTIVRWVNQGTRTHTTTSQDRRWDSGDIPPGASYSVTFNRPGTYPYYCRHHAGEGMRGTITVSASATE